MLLCGAVIAAFTALWPVESVGQVDLARTMRNNDKKAQRQTGKDRPKTKAKANAKPAKRDKAETNSSPRTATLPDNSNQEAHGVDVIEDERFKAVREQIVIERPKEEPKETSEPVYIAVEEPATFNGGQVALMKWIRDHIRYPEAAQKNGVTGRVVVRFIVEPDGSITSPSIIRSVDRDLDTEALRVVREMPKWNPGKNNGEPVRAYFNLSVPFKL